PPPLVSIQPVESVTSTGTLPISIDVQVASTLQNDASVDVYVGLYDSSAGVNQTFNGTLIAKDVPLTNGSTNSESQTSFTVSTTLDLSQLLPTQYYLYAVANDGTNSPVTSDLTGTEGTDQVVENDPVVTGTVSNQDNEALSGWTVFVDANCDGIMEADEAS